MRRAVIGVMGSGDDPCPCGDLAFALGQAIARAGWILLTGGRRSGVMDAASRGAKSVPGSLTIGVLPGDRGTDDVSGAVDIAIFTDMGNARNAINVLSSDVVVACGPAGPGTASEVALALKSGRPVILLAPTDAARRFFLESGGRRVLVASTCDEVIAHIRGLGLSL